MEVGSAEGGSVKVSVFEGEGVWAGTTDVTFTVDMHR